MSDPEDYGDGETGEEALKILIATDCHLGFMEKCSIRGEDSFTTFEEILSYGQQHKVDFVLLGGDLFHDNIPSPNAILKCMNLLRKYCLGTRPNKFQFLSDPKMIFKHCMHKTVNFEDPNLNVEMPVFSIHGNHDDPSGAGQIGSMDLLSVSGLINYFGKWTDLKKIEITPLLFKKGSTHLALYGLSYIKDQRLSRLLRDGKVDMLRPNDIKDCFNIFVLHQNRAKHSDHSFIPEQDLPDFLDFILWGHEHECRIDPEPVGSKNYRICQPGSPVATSLCAGESVEKHVGILHVNKTKFKLEKLKLKTVRPLVYDTIYLNKNDSIKIGPLKKPSDSIAKYVDEYIENDMIKKALQQHTDPKLPRKKPLLRLRIFYSKDEQKFDTYSVNQKYFSEVANQGDILVVRKSSSKSDSKQEQDIDIDDEDAIMEEAMGYDEDQPDWNKTVQGGVEKYFSSERNKKKLSVLTVLGLNEALTNYVKKQETNAFETVIEYEMEETIKFIKSKNLSDPEEIIQVINDFRKERNKASSEEAKCQIRNALESAPSPKSRKDNADSEDEDEARESGDQNITTGESPVRGRGRGRRARGARGTGTPRGRGKASTSSSANKTADIQDAYYPANSKRAGKLSVQSTSLKQGSIASHFSSSQTHSKKPDFISDSDES